MSMAILQFYKNPCCYPHYTENITTYGSAMECTPVGMNLKSGSVRVKGDMDDFMTCNYLSITRDGRTLYAWIDNVTYVNDVLFNVEYSVDAWRTYKDRINLGVQYISRQPEVTNHRDELLTGTLEYPLVETLTHHIGDHTKRVLVVQVRTSSGEIFSNSPVNPTPYQFFLKEYSVNDWLSDENILTFMTAISGAEPINIVTIYSIPYCDLSTIPVSSSGLPVETGDGTTLIEGFHFIGDQDTTELLTNTTPILRDLTNMDELLRVDHSVQLVIPEAGIISIPDELLTKSDLMLRQDVDLFSGACNYMLTTSMGEVFTQSVRGSSISSIPIVSDPMDTYLSQNQNALATSLIGDVASIVGGGAMAYGSGGILSGIGGAMATSGMSNIVNRAASIKDMASKTSNPPAFLGTALARNFNQTFWLVTTKTGVDNADDVHTNYGYPIDMVKPLIFPKKGYIQTKQCQVYAKDGYAIPRWVLDEVNTIFNSGILVH